METYLSRGESLPDIPDYKVTNPMPIDYSPIKGILAPEQTEDSIPFPLRGVATDEVLKSVLAGDRQLWVYGRISYIDFSDKPRVSAFCFYFCPDCGVGPCWVRSGPPAYHQHT
jgi:hypothetical protein